MFFSHFETFICVKTTSTKFLCFNPLRKCVIITIRLHFRNVECVFPHQRISYRITADLPINTYISEAIPVLDLAAVLWNGGQPLLVFHEIPRLFRLFDALHFGLEGWPRQHHQRDEKAHDIRISHHGSGQTKTPRAHRLSAAGGGYRGWTESTTWLAYRMRLLLEERERKGEGGREREIFRVCFREHATHLFASSWVLLVFTSNEFKCHVTPFIASSPLWAFSGGTLLFGLWGRLNKGYNDVLLTPHLILLGLRGNIFRSPLFLMR